MSHDAGVLHDTTFPLAGLRIGISGAVPEREHWGNVSDLDRLILSFVYQLSALVIEYGGRVVHGCQPLLTPVVAEAASQCAAQDSAPLILIASQLWGRIPDVAARAAKVAKNAHIILTPKIGEGDTKDPDTRNNSLTALRLALAEEIDVLVAIGGKLHSETGFNPGVLEELAIARWQAVPCFIVAGFGGLAGGLESALLEEFSEGNFMGMDETGQEPIPITIEMATWSENVDEYVGKILVHLARYRDRFIDRRKFRALNDVEPFPALGGVFGRVAKTDIDFVIRSSTKFADLRKALEDADIDAVRQTLRKPLELLSTRGIRSAGVYHGNNIRNLAVVGNSHTGKTSLVSAMIYTTGAVPKLGRVEDGSSVTDYDEEEIVRQMTVSTGIAFAEWHNGKINLLDTPGFVLFAHEVKIAMASVGAALVVVDGVGGVEVITEKVWQYAEELALPRIIVISRMDCDDADYASVLESLRNAFGHQVVPVQLPIGSEKKLRGVVDLVTMKAYTYEMAGNGKGKEDSIPVEVEAEAKDAHERLVEIIAEGKDELMEEFFNTGTIPGTHLMPALHEAIRDNKIFPVLVSSGLNNIGTDRLLDFIIDYCPPADDEGMVKGVPDTTGKQHPSERQLADAEPTSLYVFRTANDPIVGRINYFKVFSGVLKNDVVLQNFTRGAQEKLAHLSIPQGANLIPVSELHAGDIGAVTKLKDTLSGDTLGNQTIPVHYPTVTLPEPAITFAIEPKTRNDEDKLVNVIQKLMEEDLMLRFFRDEQTKEFLIAGTGQQHIEVVISKLKKRYHTEVSLKAPRVPYRETIRGKADVQGRHKKQSGGHGQYGDCKIKMEPLERGKQFEFVNDIFGGAIPRNFIPAVEKGIVEAAARGYLAGYPVVDFRVTLYDGSYDEVDSNEISFKMAGRIAFKKAMEQAKPALLEPIMKVEITIPDEFAGSIMGDLNSRRGRIQGMDNRAGKTVVKAECPMAEMLTYGADLTSMTQGRGSFSMELSHYDYVPGGIQEKIVAESKSEGLELLRSDEKLL